MLDKFKGIKKNQVIVIAIALMLISVGYLNFTSINNEIKETSSIEYAGIGDAKLVSSDSIEETALVENEEEANAKEEIGEALSTGSENIVEGNVSSKNNELENKNLTITTSSNEVDEYFANSRLNRQTMYSQMIETYENILENEQIAQDQKSIAQTEIKNINDIKNKIMICENLIKLKDIEDVIIFVNDPSVNVIVKASELKQEQIAQIQNIVTREMSADIGNIHISNR